MKVGFVVDGKAEVISLTALFPALRRATGYSFVNPIQAVVHPKSPLPRLARAYLEQIGRLENEAVELVLVLMDREDRAECPPQLARTLAEALRRHTQTTVQVVIKEAKYENWLIADVAALGRQPKRFSVSRSVYDSIVPDKADAVDALKVLQTCVIQRGYDKVRDSRRILERADPVAMAANSRSFRRFLRCLAHPDYLTQSRTPA